MPTYRKTRQTDEDLKEIYRYTIITAVASSGRTIPMPFIATIPVDQATGEVQALYEQSQATRGFVPNHLKVFSHRPQVRAAWNNLLATIRDTLDPRQFELIAIAAARALRNSYCMLAHGTVLRQQFYSPEQLTAIAGDFTTAALAPADVAMMAFAEKVARDATAITAGDIQGLRDHGFSDAEIFDIAAAAAARCFFSKLLDALGAEPDAVYTQQLEDALRRQLTVGRPISQDAVEQVLPAE
jgi:uncharacterized peroxidase-related enzyme